MATSISVLTYVVALTVTSLHPGGELRYELQRWMSGNLTVDSENCDSVRKRLVGPATRLGRIVLCDVYQQAVPIDELPKRARPQAKAKSKVPQEQGDLPDTVPNPEPRPKEKKEKKKKSTQKKEPS